MMTGTRMRRNGKVKYEVSFRVDITPGQKEALESKLKYTLKSMGLEPEALTIVLREKPDFIPAVMPATFTPVSR